MSRLEGGYLGVKPSWGTASSPGIWSLDDVYKRRANGLWPARNTSDADFNSVELLLHLTNINGSTTFADTSKNAVTVSGFGGATISTAQSKFGNGSLLLNGSSSYLTAPSSSAYDLPGNFTVEAFIYLLSLPSGGNPQRLIAGKWSNGSKAWGFFVTSTGLRFYTGGNCNAGNPYDKAFTFTTGQWYHVAATKVGSTVYQFVDGSLIGTSTNINENLSCTNTLPLYIGYDLNAGTYLHGHINDIRITKGVARYTGTYAVPTQPFPDLQ